MSRRTIMTVGFLLIFIGIQLNMVETFTLSKQATKFLVENFQDPIEIGPAINNSPFSQASYNRLPSVTLPPVPIVLVKGKEVRHPRWICWPFIFVGAVFVLHAIALRTE